MLFVRDLAEFSDDVVTFALREWRRSHDRRPSIAALRQLCMLRRHDLVTEMARREPPAAAPYRADPLSDDEKLERKAILERVARRAGLVTEPTGQWTLPPRDGVDDAPPAFPHWTSRVEPKDAAEQLRDTRIRAKANLA